MGVKEDRMSGEDERQIMLGIKELKTGGRKRTRKEKVKRHKRKDERLERDQDKEATTQSNNITKAMMPRMNHEK